MAADRNNLIGQWWRQLAFDLPRIGSHAESRKRVLLVFLSMLLAGLVLAAFAGPFLYFEYRFAGGWWGVLWIVVMYALAFTVRRSLKRRGNMLMLNLNSAPSPSLRDKLIRQRTMVAALVNRAAFEAHWAASPADARPEGDARAWLIRRLREEGVWEELPLALRDLMASPPGSWSQEQTGRVLLQMESVRVLSWTVLRDYVLPSLRTAAAAHSEILKTALAPANTKESEAFLRSELEIDAEAEPARAYLVRLNNELIDRKVSVGERDEAMDEHAGLYMAYAASVGQAEMIAEDLPIGGALIAEADSNDLLHLRAIAAVRYVTLEAVKAALLSGEMAGFREQLEGMTVGGVGADDEGDGSPRSAT